MQKLRNDMLVGMDPLSIFLNQLEKRFGSALDFGADLISGTIIGLRWKVRKRQTAVVDAASAHTLMPSTNGNSETSKQLQGQVNVPAVLQDIQDACHGLVLTLVDTSAES